MSTSGLQKGGRAPDPAKREAIIAAASESFFARGYAATAIEQVAGDAGVSKVTIYNQFGDKRGLFVAAVEHECERLRGFFVLPDADDGTLRDRLTAIGEGMSAFLSRPEMVMFERRIAAETEREPAIGAAFLAAGPHRMKEAFVHFLEALHARGEVDVPDADLAAEQFAAMVKGMGDLDRRFGMPHDAKRDRERVAGAVETFCRAYATKRARNA